MIQPLFVDIYPLDRQVDYRAFCAAGPPWTGIGFKASQGLRYRYDAWLHAQLTSFREAAGDRYGVDLFDWMYHYLLLDQDGSAQADRAMQVVEAAGGERIGTMPLVVDVERGGQAIANPTRAQVEDVVRAFAARYQQITGRLPTLYGGELLRSVGVRDRLGCGWSAVAAYGSELRKYDRSRGGYVGTTAGYLAETGTDLDRLLLWQYQGTDGQSGPPGYPRTAPGCAPQIDISAMVLPGGIERMRSLLWAERPG